MTTIKYHTKEEALTAVTQNGNELVFCTPELKNNEEVVMAAIKDNSWAFQYASDELNSNKTFILKALNEGVDPWGLIKHATISIRSDTEALSLAIEKSIDGWVFRFAKEEAALNKELAAKALVKWGKYNGEDTELLENLNPSLQDFFPENCWYEKAQAYLIQFEQEKQAKLVSGGSTTEDTVVW